MDNDRFCSLWRVFGGAVEEELDYLNDLDAAIGDADHGTNMSRGLRKVAVALDGSVDGSLRDTCKTVAMTLLSTVGGASGALWGSGLLKTSAALPEDFSCEDRFFVQAIRVFVDSIQSRGKAVMGDKTMLDVFIPAIELLEEGLDRSDDMDRLVPQVALSAQGWALGTSELLAKRGRASYLGERSIGHIDPGAYSSALWWQSLAKVVVG